MLQWQTQYLANAREIIRLSGIPQADGPQALRQAVEDRRGCTLELVAENNRLVREYLFPMLETVTRAPDDIFENLQAFAAALTAEEQEFLTLFRSTGALRADERAALNATIRNAIDLYLSTRTPGEHK